MENSFSITFYPNGTTSFYTIDGQPIEFPVLEPWISVYLEYLAAKGIPPTNCEINVFINGEWKKIKTVKTEDGWSYGFE